MDNNIDIDFLKRHGLILFEAISGSRSQGLAGAHSDTDIKGVFYLPKHLFYSNQYIEQVSNSSNDIVYYELGRFFELLLKNNPNILELLATNDEDILYKHPIMNRINIHQFLSKLVKETFAGYAFSQINKATGYNKKVNKPVETERKTVLDFCYCIAGNQSIPVKAWLQENSFLAERCGLSKISNTKGLFALYYSNEINYSGIVKNEDCNEVRTSSIPKNEKPVTYLFFNQEAYSGHCKKYQEYWSWVNKRNHTRYQTNASHGKGYDSKNMMHTIRFMQMAESILSTGKLILKVPNRDELLAIKAGKFEYDDLLNKANDLMQSIETISANSSLPDKPDEDSITHMLVNIRRELYS